MMLFLPVDTWLRLVGWLVLGLLIYFGFGYRQTIMAKAFWRQQPGNEGLTDEDYFRSDEYRRRTGTSLVFCVVVAAVALSLFAVAEVKWQRETLPEQLGFEPKTIVWLARGFAAFVVFLLLSTVVEWKRARAAVAG
jgi:hypothetical protein